MRLLVVTGAFPLWSQSFIENKVVALSERGHEVTVLATGPGDHELDRRVVGRSDGRLRVVYQPAGRTLTRLGRAVAGAVSASRHDGAFVARLAWALSRRHGFTAEFWRRLERGLPFAQHPADVVHFEWATKAAERSEVVDVLPSVTVVSCRGSDVRVLPAVDQRLAQELRWLLPRADAVHCVSEAVRTAAEGHGLERGRAFVNHPAVDCSWFAREDSPPAVGGPVHILSTGRIHWVKGYEYALRAIRLLLDRGHDVRYTIAGGGDPSSTAEIRFAVADLGLTERVTLLGPRSKEQVRRLLGEANIFLHSSVSEGLSNAVLEAMAMELPVVVTDVGGMNEVVGDGVHGYLVPSRDAPAMADRLGKLVNDPWTCARLGRQARQQVKESFDMAGQVDRFISRYEELLRARAVNR